MYVINSMILGTVIIMIMNQFTSGNDGFPFSDKPNRTLLQHSTRRHVLSELGAKLGPQKKKRLSRISYMFPYGNLLPEIQGLQLWHLFLGAWPFGKKVQDTSKKNTSFRA